MKAVILATGAGSGLSALTERYPVPLLPLGDRPFVQHVVESLVEQGVTDFDFILSHLPEKIEALLGDGTRWGARFRFHLAREASRPYGVLKRVVSGFPGEVVLMAHADRLPQVDLSGTVPVPRAGTPVLFCWRHTRSRRIEDLLQWTGWAWLSAPSVAGVPPDLDEKGFAEYLLSLAHRKGALVEVPEPLSARSYTALLDSQRAVLSGGFSGLMLSGREVEPGIRLSRNVSLHPTAKLVAPVYVGENCRVGAGVRLGPNACVGDGCVLDARSTVENALVFPGSYVGESLWLGDAFADRNRLVNARMGAAVSVADAFMLGSLFENQFRNWLTGGVSRVAAALGLALAWPILLITALCLKLGRKGAVLHRKEAVQLPAGPDSRGWRTFSLWAFCPVNGAGKTLCGPVRHFLYRFLPGLVNVLKGELSFAGVPPRSRAEIARLPGDWRAQYLSAKAGLITEADVYYGTNPSEDECFASEAFYAVVYGMGHDLKLGLRYLRTVMLNRHEFSDD